VAEKHHVIGFYSGVRRRTSELCYVAGALCVCLLMGAAARVQAAAPTQAWHIDCSASENGDGSIDRPWNNLASAEAHEFLPGDMLALARGTTCQGSFAPKGSGNEDHVIRLTAYGSGACPKIVAPVSSRQALLLFNQQYWQVDSLDISGGNRYGVFVTGDTGTLHHLYLKNLYVHDVYGAAFKNKDNGLVIVGPSSINVSFDEVVIDGVDAAHTNQWAGILVGGGSFPYKDDAPRNTNIQIRNSTAHDVYGDGIVLFRDAHSSIRTSAAWEIGMEPTQDVGTPDAIWVWTCEDCVVADNEAYLTDSPGVDGGAYDIDWDNQHDTIERNYAHDTQGYCISVFGAGYVTSDSIVRNNLCIDNGLSPRLAALQGAMYLSTWNGGTIKGLTIEGNEIHWNPPVPGAAAIEGPGDNGGTPWAFSHNTIESTSRLIYSIKTPWQSMNNKFIVDGQPVFAIGDKKGLNLEALRAQYIDSGSTIVHPTLPKHETGLRLEATVIPSFDQDGLLSDDARAQLVVLRSIAGQYDREQLRVIVHFPSDSVEQADESAIRDIGGVYHTSFEFNFVPVSEHGVFADDSIRLENPDGRIIQQWHGFQNAATLGGAVRKLLGPPDYSHMQPLEQHQGQP